MMDAFDLIALALWVTAGCQVYDRVPWHRLWGWLTAKALALRSWVFDEGYHAAVVDADDLDWVEFPNSATGNSNPGYTITLEPWDDEPVVTAPKPRRRPSRSSAAKARKDKK